MRLSESSSSSWTSSSRISTFLSNLRGAPSRALLMDYDGTLAPFSRNPERAVPYPEIASALNRIRLETDTRLVIVTGRPASHVPRLLNVAHIEVWGCHGMERLKPDGTCEISRIDPHVLASIETASMLIAREGLSDFAEHKIASIAVHWRGREAIAEHITRRMLRVWSMIPDRNQLRLAPFDGGIEIRSSLGDKGDVVRTILKESGLDVAIAYLGDDETDEDAFGALHGRGLNVLIRGEFRPTLADAWIQPPDGLLAFLEAWLAAGRVVSY